MKVYTYYKTYEIKTTDFFSEPHTVRRVKLSDSAKRSTEFWDRGFMVVTKSSTTDMSGTSSRQGNVHLP
jgi:hypothetical protein